MAHYPRSQSKGGGNLVVSLRGIEDALVIIKQTDLCVWFIAEHSSPDLSSFDGILYFLFCYPTEFVYSLYFQTDLLLVTRPSRTEHNHKLSSQVTIVRSYIATW